MSGRAFDKRTKREETRIPSQEDTRTSQQASVPVEEQIRQRAHDIYLQHGGQRQSATEDWLQAESEILQPRAKA